MWEVFRKIYLGDGVYAAFEDGDLIVTTENGIETTNRIVLEPGVWVNLLEYVNQIQQQAQREKPAGMEPAPD